MHSETAERDWDAFEALVSAHKQAVARVIRIEDQLIDLMRSHRSEPLPEQTARYSAALDEARSRVLETGYALFPAGPAVAAVTPTIANA